MDNNSKKLTEEFVRGLVVGEGCFTFSRTTKYDNSNKKIGSAKIPAFCLVMHIRDFDLIDKARECIGLNNKIYTRKAWTKDGINRGATAVLIVREFSNIRNKIIPFFYKKLHGYKLIQFEQWLENIGNDPLVPFKYKKVYWLHKAGYYDNPESFKDLNY